MAEEQNMAKVKVNRRVVIVPNQTSTVVYPEGFEGTAPNDHIEQIVSGGYGERLDGSKRAAENQDASKSGGNNANA